MKNIFYTFSKILQPFPLEWLIQLTGQSAIFPFYHVVSDRDVPHIKHLYKVKNIQTFERDLDFLLKNYTPINLEDLMSSFVEKRAIREKVFLLSFDDGLREFHDIIAPILQRKGVPSICFLNTAFLDNKDLFYRYKASVLIDEIKSSTSENLVKKIRNCLVEKDCYNKDINQSILSITYSNRKILDELASILEVDFKRYLKERLPYLTSNNVKTLIDQGFYFGAHSIDHPLYSKLDLSEQIFQTEQSVKDIMDLFGLGYKVFSFPFTDHGVSKDFFNHFYTSCNKRLDLTFGCAGLKKDIVKNNVQRIPIENGDFSARDIVYGEYLYYAFKSLLGKNTIHRS